MIAVAIAVRRWIILAMSFLHHLKDHVAAPTSSQRRRPPRCVKPTGRTPLFTTSHRSELLVAKLGLSPIQPGGLIEVPSSAFDFTSFQIHVDAMVVSRRVR